MQRYVVNNNTQANGDHEVHKSDCRYFPSNYKDLGWHSTCITAVAEAKKTYWKSNGCIHCSPGCHTT